MTVGSCSNVSINVNDTYSSTFYQTHTSYFAHSSSTFTMCVQVWEYSKDIGDMKKVCHGDVITLTYWLTILYRSWACPMPSSSLFIFTVWAFQLFRFFLPVDITPAIMLRKCMTSMYLRTEYRAKSNFEIHKNWLQTIIRSWMRGQKTGHCKFYPKFQSVDNLCNIFECKKGDCCDVWRKGSQRRADSHIWPLLMRFWIPWKFVERVM